MRLRSVSLQRSRSTKIPVTADEAFDVIAPWCSISVRAVWCATDEEAWSPPGRRADHYQSIDVSHAPVDHERHLVHGGDR
jgi:hypothetical protein